MAKPAIALSSDDVAALSSVLGLNISSPAQLLDRAQKLTTLSVEGVTVTLSPATLTRLKSRCPKKVDFPSWLRDRVREWANSYVGA